MICLARVFSRARAFSWTSAAPAVVLCALLSGCQEQEIRVYNIPKEKQTASARSQGMHWHWTLPDGWKEKPADGMRAGSFSIAGTDGRDADVSIIPLTGGAGTELDNVNRWRKQVGLEAVESGELGKLGEKTDIGDATAPLYDFDGTDSQTKLPTRILAAMLPQGETTWFFKMTGSPDLVAKQKDAFKQLLKSVHFGESDAAHGAASAEHRPSAPAAPPSGQTPAQPTWEVPPGWTLQPPAPMLLARFVVAKTDRMTTEATVSSFPGSVGGLRDNINRWRNQIGLGPVVDSEVASLTSNLEVNGQQATLVDMANTSSNRPPDAKGERVIVVMLARDGQTWFFKLMGENQVVEREKSALIQFVRSVRYPNA